MAKIGKKRIRVIALQLACSAVYKELVNPSEMANGILDFDIEQDGEAVYDELNLIYGQLVAKLEKASLTYIRD
jgi:hypothetical protein